MPERKRTRRYPNKNCFGHFARQTWKDDWWSYTSPSTRVEDWALLQAMIYSSARVGEYIESLARKGSGRGLHYKVCKQKKVLILPSLTQTQDIMMIVFLNEDDKPELAFQLTKDAKNMSDSKHRR